MHEASELFLSLPPSAQQHLRTAARHRDPDLRALVRAIYPYVQTLSDAHDIAEFLAGQATLSPPHFEEALQLPALRSRSLPELLSGLLVLGATAAARFGLWTPARHLYPTKNPVLPKPATKTVAHETYSRR